MASWVGALRRCPWIGAFEPDLAAVTHRNREDGEARALTVQTETGPQIVSALVQRTNYCSAARQTVGERSIEMRALRLRREHLVVVGAKDGNAPAANRKCPSLSRRDLRKLADHHR